MVLFVPGPVGKLEASLWMPAEGRPPRAACVVCHPHPLGGGTMKTTAVFRIARGLQLAGLGVLRFNFRGVERSEGVHDGHGAEEDDFTAALDWMQRELSGVELWGAGFSFGARTVASRVSREPRVRRIVLVALPVAAFDCSAIRAVATPGLILQAGEDSFGDLSELRRRFPELSAGLELAEIPGTDHYFYGASQELQERVRRYAERSLGG